MITVSIAYHVLCLSVNSAPRRNVPFLFFLRKLYKLAGFAWKWCTKTVGEMRGVMMKSGGSKPPPYEKELCFFPLRHAWFWRPPRGDCRAGRGWGRMRKEKGYKVINLARHGLLPSRLRRATSLPEEGNTLSVTLTRATSPRVRSNLRREQAPRPTIRNDLSSPQSETSQRHGVPPFPLAPLFRLDSPCKKR